MSPASLIAIPDDDALEIMVAAMIGQSTSYPIVPPGNAGQVDPMHPFMARVCLLAALKAQPTPDNVREIQHWFSRLKPPGYDRTLGEILYDGLKTKKGERRYGDDMDERTHAQVEMALAAIVGLAHRVAGNPHNAEQVTA